MKFYLIGIGTDEEFVENHKYIFKIAENTENAIKEVKTELSDIDFHFDSIMEINFADGRKLKIQKEGKTSETLYAVFIGYYLKGDPVEHHNILFVVEHSPESAMDKARQIIKMLDAITPHVDMLKELKEIDGWQIIPESSSRAEPNRMFYYDDIKRILERI